MAITALQARFYNQDFSIGSNDFFYKGNITDRIKIELPIQRNAFSPTVRVFVGVVNDAFPLPQNTGGVWSPSELPVSAMTNSYTPNVLQLQNVTPLVSGGGAQPLIPINNNAVSRTITPANTFALVTTSGSTRTYSIIIDGLRILDFLPEEWLSGGATGFTGANQLRIIYRVQFLTGATIEDDTDDRLKAEYNVTTNPNPFNNKMRLCDFGGLGDTFRDGGIRHSLVSISGDYSTTKVATFSTTHVFTTGTRVILRAVKKDVASAYPTNRYFDYQNKLYDFAVNSNGVPLVSPFFGELKSTVISATELRVEWTVGNAWINFIEEFNFIFSIGRNSVAANSADNIRTNIFFDTLSLFDYDSRIFTPQICQPDGNHIFVNLNSQLSSGFITDVNWTSIAGVSADFQLSKLALNIAKGVYFKDKIEWQNELKFTIKHPSGSGDFLILDRIYPNRDSPVPSVMYNNIATTFTVAKVETIMDNLPNNFAGLHFVDNKVINLAGAFPAPILAAATVDILTTIGTFIGIGKVNSTTNVLNDTLIFTLPFPESIIFNTFRNGTINGVDFINPAFDFIPTYSILSLNCEMPFNLSWVGLRNMSEIADIELELQGKLLHSYELPTGEARSEIIEIEQKIPITTATPLSDNVRSFNEVFPSAPPYQPSTVLPVSFQTFEVDTLVEFIPNKVANYVDTLLVATFDISAVPISQQGFLVYFVLERGGSASSDNVSQYFFSVEALNVASSSFKSYDSLPPSGYRVKIQNLGATLKAYAVFNKDVVLSGSEYKISARLMLRR